MAQLISVSVLIPTLNAARVLGRCLASIARQDYPKNKVEIIIADGGSTDDTLSIISKFKIQNSKLKVKILANPLKTGEAGKVIALRRAKGELMALFDSDNVLPTKDWLRRMIEPFSDSEVLGAEPWEFTYRKKDSLVNRYCALIGANDPYCYFVGNYDKRSVLSGKWTGLKVQSQKFEVRSGKIRKTEGEKWDYLKVQIKLPSIPTIGANGTIWRTGILRKAVGENNYLFDIEIPYVLASQKPFWFAKVKVGIVHLYCHQIKDFYRKQKRRAKDFFYQEKRDDRRQTYQRQLDKQLYFIFSTVTILPLIFQSIKGYFRNPDRAWFFHPLACLMTLWLYGTETILAKFKTAEMDRSEWRQ